MRDLHRERCSFLSLYYWAWILRDSLWWSCAFRCFVCIIVYLVGGVLVLRYWRGASGVELIPNFEFWKSLPGLVKVCSDFQLLECSVVHNLRKLLMWEETIWNTRDRHNAECVIRLDTWLIYRATNTLSVCVTLFKSMQNSTGSRNIEICQSLRHLLLLVYYMHTHYIYVE